MKILLIDDDEIDRESIRRALRGQQGIQITEADRASEGLRLFGEQDFDLILLDYYLPEMDGLATLAELARADKPTTVIMLSNSEDDSVAAASIEAGAQDFIVKKDVTAGRLKRDILLAKKRFELERQVARSNLQLKVLAERDRLTGMANQHLLESWLYDMLAKVESQGPVALMVMDLDHFKFINDTYGHDFGDKVIHAVAKRLEALVPEGISIARLGGDEFALLCQGQSAEKSLLTAARHIIKGLQHQLQVDEMAVTVCVSVGISSCKVEGEPKVLLKEAEIAMYRAKKSNGSEVQIFHRDMEDVLARRVAIEEGINRVLAARGFFLEFQPQVDTHGRTCGFEALIRWPVGDESYYRPDEFIPVAEETQLISKIDYWVFVEAVKCLKGWQLQLDKKATVAINLSPIQLMHPQLSDKLRAACANEGVLPQDITIEITETALMNDDFITSQQIQKLSDDGFKVALDDFGTGYSSISHLLTHPIDIVKIDRSVLPKDMDATKHYSIFIGLTRMVASLGLITVVEGVETNWQYRMCQNLGVDKMQGYFIQRPMRMEDIDEQSYGRGLG